MGDSRFKDRNWNLANQKGGIDTWEMVQVAVLMDIRDELKAMNAILHCSNFLRIPHTLESIQLNTKRKKKRRAIGKPKLRVVARS